ncbi:hypothetical protein Cni_G12630 [Canna indica]|uniref:Reverse transcriptase domain-containing protein n=1 Tax=Canna indica TaxID=4628 RepID=A0AAQ3K8N8_9LILI|nr:hypothetical protein Cni_G12630 [Canna indica]
MAESRFDIKVDHLQRISSDHRPILVNAGKGRKKAYGGKGFIFEHFLFEYPSLRNTVENCWNNGGEEENFSEKLNSLKVDLQEWNRKEVGQLERNLKRSLESLKKLEEAGEKGLYWETIKQKLKEEMDEFHRTAQLVEGWNDTLLVMIQKKEKASKVTEFRPIALCNVVYEIVAKTIANRIRPLLGKIISKEQAAFIPGRQLHDNILILNEIVNSFYSLKARNPYIILKIDLQKAYDRELEKYGKVKELLNGEKWDSKVLTYCFGELKNRIESIIVDELEGEDRWIWTVSLWGLSKNRNEYKHKGVGKSLKKNFQNALVCMGEYNNVSERGGNRMADSGKCLRRSEESGLISDERVDLFCDAAWRSRKEMCCGFFSYWKDNCMLAGSHVDVAENPLQAKLKAIWFGMDNARRKGVKKLKVYSDCDRATRILNGEFEAPWESLWLKKKIDRLARDFENISWGSYQEGA